MLLTLLFYSSTPTVQTCNPLEYSRHFQIIRNLFSWNPHSPESKAVLDLKESLINHLNKIVKIQKVDKLKNETGNIYTGNNEPEIIFDKEGNISEQKTSLDIV